MDGEGAVTFKPFLEQNNASKSSGTNLDGKNSKSDFQWYMEVKKWLPGLGDMANQTQAPYKVKM